MAKAKAKKMANKGKDEENQMKLAEKWAKAISKLPEIGLYILWRTNGEFVGVGPIERRPENGTYRELIRYVRPDGRMGEEPLDYKPDPHGDPVSAVPLVMSKPLIITARRKPGFDDSEDNFEWIMDFTRATYYQNLRDDVIRLRNENSELLWRLDELNMIIQRQQKEITVLSERTRMLEEKLEMATRENVLLKSLITQLEEVAKKALAGYVEAESALNEVMRKAEVLGQYRVMGPVDKVKAIVDETKEVVETIQSYGTGMMDETVIIHKINEFKNEINNRLKRLEDEIRSNRTEKLEKKEAF